MNIGTAGWAIPRVCSDYFPASGTSLERYATRFEAAEINSSFHRPHRRSTWERWCDTVPPWFRFSVKLPKSITHQAKLVDCAALITEFIAEVSALSDKLKVLLVQLPPKLEFNAPVAASFFSSLSDRTAARIVCEPRHPSWFAAEPSDLLDMWKVARVAADPAICEAAAHPGGWRHISYWRLHGSPQIYRSSYAPRLPGFAASLRDEAAAGRECWCIFDNTASGAATGDALSLKEELGRV